jgi:hypothetical protein
VTRISGTLTNAFSSWSRLIRLSLSRTSVSGSLGPAFGTWVSVTSIDFSFCALTNVDSSLFALPRLATLLLAGNSLFFPRGSQCPRTLSRASMVDVSANNWTGVNFADAVDCYASQGTLLLDDNGLTGFASRRLFVPSAARLQRLSLAGNAITTQAVVTGLDGNVPDVDLHGNPLGPSFSLDRPTQDQSPITSLNVDNTGASYCYAGPFLSTTASLRLVNLRGVSSVEAACRDRIESVSLDSRPFTFCTDADRDNDNSSALPQSLHDVYCMQANKRVVFPLSGLTCPQWSTFASLGLLVLDVDEVCAALFHGRFSQ